MTWQSAYLESRILSADPLELVSLLYQGALDSVHDARKYLADGDIQARSTAISKVTDIVTELEASLNHEAGGSISRGLADLYQYMRMRLLHANIRQDDAILAEVQSLLATMAEAWKGIQKTAEHKGDAVSDTPTGKQLQPPWSGAFEAERGAEFAAHGWSA